jgi:hypothetical protein
VNRAVSRAGVRAALRADLRQLAGAPRERLVRKLTCLFLATYASFGVGFAVLGNRVIAGLAIALLLGTELAAVPALWIGLFLLMASTLACQWYALDNHKFLMAYWVLACGLALREPDSERSDRFLAWSAELLIGLTFAFGCLWKLLAGEYLDGAFFLARLLGDPRFRAVAALLSGLEDAALSDNLRRIDALRHIPGAPQAVVVATTARLHVAALALSGWTLAIEAAIAVLFLGRRFWRRSLLPDLCLLAFLATAYIGAPVGGFGSLLAILGVAQCDPSRPRLRLAYVALFLFCQLVFAIAALAS